MQLLVNIRVEPHALDVLDVPRPGTERNAIDDVLYRRIVFGVIDKPNLMGIADLTGREVVTLLPLGLLTIFYGVHPQPIIDASAASIEQIISGFQHAITATKSAGL